MRTVIRDTVRDHLRAVQYPCRSYTSEYVSGMCAVMLCIKCHQTQRFGVLAVAAARQAVQ